MATLILTRTEQSPDGTFGTLVLSNQEWCTCEDDWLNNVPRTSCIPAGTYTLVRSIWHKHGIETFEVTGVPGRSRILIHYGNTEEDVEGCILVGNRIGELVVKRDEDTGELNKRKQAVVDSRNAFSRLMASLGSEDTHTLLIRWAAGLPA